MSLRDAAWRPEELSASAKTAGEAALRYSHAVLGSLQRDPGAQEGQFRRHGSAWVSAYAAALQALAEWAARLSAQGRLDELERLILAAAFGEYLDQLCHGIAMSQDEVVRPSHLGAEAAAAALAGDEAAGWFLREGGVRRLGAALLDAAERRGDFGALGLDETLMAMREQIRRFVEEEVVPEAPRWHREDLLIPDGVIAAMADLGVFAITVPEEYGGLGLGKIAMCLVTEELSRGYIGVGSLGTRSEIAGDLIQIAGTEAQKDHYLPRLASGEIIPTAVFTEPNTGSDLASITTRAERTAGGYRITGNKTWITHGARSDLMTLMARSDPKEPGHRGLTMFLVDKTRGRDGEPFPDPGMSGGEIPVLGYRGMKEYDIAFDGFEVPESAVLGGQEGRGFRDLMATFESARIQTAARALGVAQNALELALSYARERRQFGKPILAFERIYGKLAWMIAETMLVRQLVHAAASKKDRGERCDVEAGMAKLLAARLAWSVADNALQIHGGNGYALEYPISRVLCDARILNIFEGAAEIQAEVIARGLARALEP